MREDARRYAESTIRLLQAVPQQRPDAVAERDAKNNIEVIQSRLKHLEPALRDTLALILERALAAAQNSQLGLTLAYMERARDLLAESDPSAAG
jgi:hypothetical protein